MARKLVSLATLALAAASCAPAAPPPAAAPPSWIAATSGQKGATSGTSLERFFPLVDGMVYTYETTAEGGERGVLAGRVFRADARRGELRYSNGSKTFVYEADGVVLESRGVRSYLLKAPLEVGATWRGEHGGQVRVASVTASAETPMGHLDGCVQTIEERLGDRPARYTTVYCPEVGVVSLEVSASAGFARAALQSYGPPLAMKPDGIERMPQPTRPP